MKKHLVLSLKSDSVVSVQELLMRHKTMRVSRKRTISELYVVLSDNEWHDDSGLYNFLAQKFNPSGCYFFYEIVRNDLRNAIAWFKFNDLVEFRPLKDCSLNEYKIKSGVVE